MNIRSKILRYSRSFGWTTLAFLLTSFCTPHQASAQFAKILRDAMKVADNVPLNKVDDVMQEVASSKSLKEAMGRQIDNWAELSDVQRRLQLDNQFKIALKNLDPVTVKAISSLDETAKPAALILVEGSQAARKAVPDIAERAKFLKAGGAETVMAIGMHGDEAAQQARLLNRMIESGDLSMPAGLLRPATLQDFGILLTKGGDKAWVFWTKCVKPYPKEWLAGGALAAFLVNPDPFIDATGNITEYGITRVGELAGAAFAGTLAGIGEAGKTIAKDIVDTAKKTYFSDLNGIYAAIAMVVVVALLIPRTRQILFRSAKHHLAAQPTTEESSKENSGHGVKK